MRSIAYLVLIAFTYPALLLGQAGTACLPCANMPGSWAAEYAEDEIVPGFVVVGLRAEYLATATLNSFGNPELENLLGRIGVESVRQRFPRAAPPRQGYPNDVEIRTQYLLKLAPGADVKRTIKALAGYTEWFAFAEPLFKHQAFTPYYPNDYNPAASWFGPLVQAPEAWGVHPGDTNTVIAIIDVGTYFMHPDLFPNVYRNHADPINGADDDGDGYIDNYYGWDFCGNSFLSGLPQPDANPQPSAIALDHGTFTAGLSSAATDNSLGVVGSGFRCRFMPLKTSCEAYGQNIYFGYDAIVYAADHGASVINCSWGGFSYSLAQLDIVRYATYNRNALVVAAGGNDPAPTAKIPYPARFADVLCVTGSTNADALGQNTAGCRIDVAAPGNSLLVHPNGNYFSFAGTFTSFAAPVVSGIAGLVRSLHPGHTPQQVRQQIRATASDVYSLPANAGLQYKYGRGRVNAHAALTVTTPGVQVDSFTVSDGNNNLPQAGDTVTVVFGLTNYLAPTTNLQLQAILIDSLCVEWVSGNSIAIGALNTLESVSNSSSPLVFRVLNNAPINKDIEIRLVFTDGSYWDYQCIYVKIHPNLVHINSPVMHQVASSLSHIGQIGGSGYGEIPGQGFAYRGRNYLYEGGTIMGPNRNQLADNLRQSSGPTFSADFSPTTYITTEEPGIVSSQDVVANYADSGLTPPNSVLTTLEAYAWRDAPYDKFILLRYILANETATPKDSIYLGWMMDWDIGPVANLNYAAFDSALRLSYAWGDVSPPFAKRRVGLTVLTDNHNVHSYSRDVVSAAFSDSAKFLAISSGTSSASSGPVDVVQFTGVGPIALPANGFDTITIAIVAGDSLLDLQSQVHNARDKYYCTFIDDGAAWLLPPTALNATPLDCNSLHIEWVPDPNALGCAIEVSQSPTFDTVSATYLVFQSNDTTLSNLLPGTDYYIRVQSFASPRCVRSPFGAAVTASTGAMPAPPVISLAVPPTCDAMDIEWGAVAGITDYWVEVSTDSTFSVGVLLTQNVGGATAFSFTASNPGATYYFRVRGQNTCGFTAYSQKLVVATPPAGVTPNRPIAFAVFCNSFKLRWPHTAFALQYEVQVSTSPSFASLLPGFPALVPNTDSVLAVLGLSDSSRYYYRLRAIGPCAPSSWTNTDSVLTQGYLPAVVAIAPTNVFTCRFTARWNPIAGMLGHSVTVATTPDFSVLLSGYEDTLVFGLDSLVVQGLAPSTTYYYRVSPVNTCTPLPISNTVSVTTAPSLLSATADPATNIACTSFRANWQLQSNVTRYLVDVSLDPLFATFVLQNAAVGHPTAFRNITGLAHSTTYYYRIRATDGCDTSAFSQVMSATTLAPPSVTTTLAATAITSCAFRANWSASPGASTYFIDISTTPTFDPGTLVRDNFNTGNVLFLNQTGLMAGTTYYYRVRAANSCGNLGNSNVVAVSLPIQPQSAPVLTLASPANCTGFALAWDPVVGANGYYLDVSLSPTFATFIPGFNNLNIGNVVTYTVGTLTPNTQYYARLRAYSFVTCPVSPNSDTLSILTAPSLSAPVAYSGLSIGCTQFTANWSPVGGATAYLLTVSTSPTFATTLPGYTSLNVGSDTSYSVTGLSLNTTYYYRVVAANAVCTSAVSNRPTVVTLNTATTPATAAASAILCDQFQANWLASAGATAYLIQVATDAGFATILPGFDSLNVGNALSLAVSGLSPNTNYYYRLAAVNACGVSNFSAGRLVTTRPALATPPTANAATSVGQCFFTANWAALANAQGYLFDLATDITFSSGFIHNGLDVGSVTSFVCSGLLPGVTYYYRVRGYNNCSVTGFSNVVTRATSVVPVPASAAASLVQPCQFQANWANPAGNPAPSHYLLDVSTSPTFATNIHQDLNVGTSLNYLVTGLTPNTSYYYRVRNVTSCGTSGYSTTRTVTTTSSVAAPTTSPHSGVTCNSFIANWNAATGATHYLLSVSTDPGFSTYLPGYSSINVGPVLSYTVSPILHGATYYYRVQAVTECGTSAPSASRTVSLIAGTPGLWTGNAGDSDWHNCQNWDNLQVPTSGNVVIPNSAITTPYNIPAVTLNSLSLDNPIGARLAGNLTVSAFLKLANGVLDAETNAAKVTVLNNALDAVRNAANLPVSHTDVNSYVNGELVRAVASTGAYHWPIGCQFQRRYGAISIHAKSNALTSISMRYSNTPPTGFTPALHFSESGAYFNTLLPEGCWAVEPDAGSATYDAEFWPNFPLVCCQVYTLAKRTLPGFDWGVHSSSGHYPTPSGVSSSGSIRRNGYSSFSSFGIVGSSDAVLPLNALELTGGSYPGYHNLYWRFLEPFQYDSLILYARGANESNFAACANVSDRTENSLSRIITTSESVYYQLVAVGFDGQKVRSNTIELAPARSADVKLYPNPSSGHLQLSVWGQGRFSIQIIDAVGRTVYSPEPIQHSQTLLDLSHLTDGVYQLRLFDAGGAMVTNQTLVIQR